MFNSKRTATLFLFVLAPFVIWGNEYSDPPVSARTTALGYAGASLHVGGFASYWNPALLPRLKTWNLALTQAKVAGDTQLYYGAFATPLWRGLGASFSWSNVVITDQGKTEILRDEAGNIIVDPLTGKPEEVIMGFCDQSNNVFGIGLGFGKGYLTLGGTAKMVYNRFSNDHAYGIGWDAGMNLVMWKLFLGFSAKNVGDIDIDWKKKEDELIESRMRVDGAIKLYEGELGGIETQMNVFCGGSFEEEENRADFGYECRLMRLVYLRAGVKGREFCTGVGFKSERLQVDYAFTQSNEFYSHHRISFELKGVKKK